MYATLKEKVEKMNVIFDMGGLMFETEKVFIKAWDYAGEKIGIGKAGYMVYKTLGMSIVASYEIWKEEFGDRYNQEECQDGSSIFITPPVGKWKNIFTDAGVINYFSVIVCGDMVKKSKPAPDILQIIKGKYSDLEQVKKAFESGEL